MSSVLWCGWDYYCSCAYDLCSYKWVMFLSSELQCPGLVYVWYIDECNGLPVYRIVLIWTIVASICLLFPTGVVPSFSGNGPRLQPKRQIVLWPVCGQLDRNCGPRTSQRLTPYCEENGLSISKKQSASWKVWHASVHRSASCVLSRMVSYMLGSCCYFEKSMPCSWAWIRLMDMWSQWTSKKTTG